MGSALTAQERATLKQAAFGAVFLVANAEPGLLALVSESFAASDAIAGSAGLVHEVLTTGPLPQLPDSAVEVERVVLPALQRSVQILRAKAPQEVAHYRAVVLAAAERTAQATAGVSVSEAAAVDRIRAALSDS
ncbi:MAG TPA: hypothetical protein VF174_12655 [Micromonosporaceae bacterium]